MKDPDEHTITDRENRTWQAGKKVTKRERPELTVEQRLQFLDLFVKMASQATFERILGLESKDVEYYRQFFNIESHDEARILLRKLRQENEEGREAAIVAETKLAREAEVTAQRRLSEMEARRNRERPIHEVDANKIKQEDAERQRRFADQQEKLEEPKQKWQLPMEGTLIQREEQVDRFRRAITNHGYTFVRNTYGATPQQVRHEAGRLGLKINWDLVRR